MSGITFLHDYSYIYIPPLSLAGKTLVVSYTGSASGQFMTEKVYIIGSKGVAS